MLEKLKLDDSSYNSIYEKAIQRIDTQAPWWTHRETADPGITLLEMWALLCDMQSFYLDQVQESHYRKYLKLLGILPEEGQYASAWVFFDRIKEDTLLPEGTRLLADTMVFETVREVKLTANRLIAFYPGQEAGDEEVDCFCFMDRFRKTSIPLRQGKVLFVFVLKSAVEAGDILSFFVLLDETGGRTPAGEGFFLAPLVWEYMTGQGYVEAYVIEDGTKGLLYSGYVRLRIGQPMFPLSGGVGYPIRCRMKEEACTFDVMPVIYRIFLNMVQVFQKNTLCREEDFTLCADTPRICLKSYLALTGDIKVYVKCGEGEWEDVTKDCEITPPITAERKTRYITLGTKHVGKITAEGHKNVKIVCSLNGFEESYFPCAITGVSTQKIPLPWENLKRDSVRLMLCQDETAQRFREYHMAEPEDDRNRYVWHWQEEKNVIELGDGRHGEIPPSAKDGLRLTALVLWEGEQGNAAIGRIQRLERPDLFPGIRCQNLMTGKGGRKREKPSVQFLAVWEQLLRENRMVTEEDIGRLAMETPGLMIKRVRAAWKEGKILVTVFPTAILDQYCEEKYIAQVKKYLEQYRLVGTKIEVEIGRLD